MAGPYFLCKNNRCNVNTHLPINNPIIVNKNSIDRGIVRKYNNIHIQRCVVEKH